MEDCQENIEMILKPGFGYESNRSLDFSLL